MNGTGVKISMGSKHSPVVPLPHKKGVRPLKAKAVGNATKYTFNNARMVASANKQGA